MAGLPADAVEKRWLRAATEPMRSWGRSARWAAVFVGVLLGVAVSLAVAPVRLVFHSPDSSHYLKIAAGHTEQVMQPFASRQLGARLAAWLGQLLGGNLHAGFWVEAMLSLVLAMGATCWLAARTAAPRWMLLAVMLVPSWPRLVEYLVLPDLWYAGLLALLLLLLEWEQYMLAAVMMCPLMLSRESTSLTLVCFLVACWRLWEPKQRWRYSLVAVVSAAAGSAIVAKLTAGSQMNKEHLPEAVYLFAKVPWNFARNVLGVLPWSDANNDLCKVPAWSTPFHFGPVHALGVCGFSVGPQVYAIEGVLTNFGLLPLLAAVLWWRHRRMAGRSLPQTGALLRFALIYGGVCFVLSPVLGAGVVHLMQYAWPLFLIAVPLLMDEFSATLQRGNRGAGLGFFAVHLVLPAILIWPYFWSRMAMGLVLWGLGWVCLRRWLPAAAEVPVSA